MSYRTNRAPDEPVSSTLSPVEVIGIPGQPGRYLIARTRREGGRRLHFALTIEAGRIDVSVTRAVQHGQSSRFHTTLDLTPEQCRLLAEALTAR